MKRLLCVIFGHIWRCHSSRWDVDAHMVAHYEHCERCDRRRETHRKGTLESPGERVSRREYEVSL